MSLETAQNAAKAPTNQTAAREHSRSASTEQRLKELGIQLHGAAGAVRHLCGSGQTGNLLFLTGMLPREGRAAKFIGRIGAARGSRGIGKCLTTGPLSEALLETEASTPRFAPTDTKVSPEPSSNCFACTVLVSSLRGKRLDGGMRNEEFQLTAAKGGFGDKKNSDSIAGRWINRPSVGI